MAVPCALTACVIHHVTPYVPDAGNAPQTAGAAEASTSCFEASTPAERAICAAPALAPPNLAMVESLQADIRGSSVFGRDALLASQRQWLLGLPGRCGLTDTTAGTPGAEPCLQAALRERIGALQAWPGRDAPRGGAITQYVNLRPVAGAAPQADPAFCAAFARRADLALSRTGSLDPAAMGYQEVAGTHGPATSPPVSVDVYDANVYALFEKRARSVTVGTAPPAITTASLGQLLVARSSANEGGRFSNFASQTGDYAGIDVFADGSRQLVVAAEAWGSTTPASPGESAHAGVWALDNAAATPLCLYDTYTRPAEPGVFDSLPSFTPWRVLLSSIRASAEPALSEVTRRDQGQLDADTDFVVLHMPILAVQQATPRVAWLRHRHDEVLDALFAWSGKAPENKAMFDQAFALLRPAAADLVHAYQSTQGLDASEATQAGGIAVMELLYQAVTTIDPGLGASPETPAAYRPRYPILAAPQ